MEKRPLFQVQPCVLCGGATARKFTELTYQFDRLQIVVKGVPVATCEGCDEEFVPGDFGVWLGDEVAKIADHLQSIIAQEDALRDLVVNFGVDEQKLVSSGRVRLPALA